MNPFIKHFKKSQTKDIYIFKTIEIQRKKFNFRFFTRKVKQIFFSKATFFYFPFFSVSPILANIWVEFANNFKFFKCFVLFGKYVIYCKKIRFLSITYFVPQSSEKVTFIEGGSRTLGQHCTLPWVTFEEIFDRNFQLEFSFRY